MISLVHDALDIVCQKRKGPRGCQAEQDRAYVRVKGTTSVRLKGTQDKRTR